MINAAGQTHTWLNLLNNHKRPKLSMYITDYENLKALCGVPADRIIKDENGKPVMIVIVKALAIQLLKSKFRFVTKQEAASEIEDAAKEEAKYGS